MLDPGLRKSYWLGKIMAFLLSRQWSVKLIYKSSARLKGKNIVGLHCEERFIPSRNGGPDIRVRIYKPLQHNKDLPGMVYIHGGGYMIGNPESFAETIKGFIEASPCVVVAPDYRKALEAPFPAAFDDCYDTLLWMKENAVELGIYPDKFIVGGHSAGGGLTAAVTLKATDTKEVNITFQMPIYPMIDDQYQFPSSEMDSLVWNGKSNHLGWDLYLKGLKEKGQQIPYYAAPARATDFSKHPPSITFVGDMEPFRDETMAYVDNLKKAGIPVEFQLFKGCFHGFDSLAPDAAISKEAVGFLLTHYKEYSEKYF